MKPTATITQPPPPPRPAPTLVLELDLEAAKAVATLLGNATRRAWEDAVKSREWNRNQANGDPLELASHVDGHVLTADAYFALEEALTTHYWSAR